MKAMEEELNQIEKNYTWELVPRKVDRNVIGRKWVFWKKMNEYEEVTRNKEILVSKGYSEVKGIDFEETFTLVARMEALRIFLAFIAYQNFKLYLMDVKSTLLHGELEEEIYIDQPDGFHL